MEETLLSLGLTNKEAQLYLYLISQKPLPAATIAEQIQESRTNTYALLSKLHDRQLVAVSNDTTVKTYIAAHPKQLRALLIEQQNNLRQSQAGLTQILPQLTSTFNLNQQRPGVVHFVGIEGFKEYQADIASAAHIDVIGGSTAPDNNEAWQAITDSVIKRYAKGTIARLLLHEDARDWLDIEHYKNERGFDVRFWGEQPYEADIVIYDEKLGMTSYESGVVTTVIQNKVIAGTFRRVFDAAWRSALEK